MKLTETKKKEYMKRLLLARMRILINHGFYGLLLMHMKYAIDETKETAGTDGERIIFGCEFLEELSDSELDFVLMHEILHVVLQHCQRGQGHDHGLFNIACDIVVNSNILKSRGMRLSAITLEKYGVSMHLAPDGKEGFEYTAEEVYGMLTKGPQKRINLPGIQGEGPGTWDDHSHWKEIENDEILRDTWAKRLQDAYKTISIQDPSNTRGMIPMCAQRIFMELTKAQTDWRTILNDFVQEEVVDYSFTPPDRRFDDNPFFLPDFNEKDDLVEDVLFMIDTSGSMSDQMITAAYSEVKGAIDQFDGKLKGWLGFFDAGIVEPEPFSDEGEFSQIKAAGGGGTDFRIIFDYVRDHMTEKPPVSIIILTDGYAPFPAESEALGIPVLWLLNNDQVEPPWGKIARIN